VGLIQSVIEREGIPTTSVTMLREITEKVEPPRALFVDTPLGYPLGEPDNPAVQRQILEAALGLLHRRELPILKEFATL
jgi:D-proline reductase (dithiol) PrdB